MRNARPVPMRRRLVAMLAFALICGPAHAHLDSSGMGPIYDGLMHFLTSPEDLVPALALALLAGLRGAAYGRRAMFTLPAAWLLGSLVGLSAAVAQRRRAGGCALVPAAGRTGRGRCEALAARDDGAQCTARSGPRIPQWNGNGPVASAVVAVVGLAAAVFVLVILFAAASSRLRAHWARIAVRVGGSWIAASGLLMLGWSLR